MPRAVVVLVGALALLASCKKKREEPSAWEAKPYDKPPAQRANSVDEMVRTSFDQLGKDHFVSKVSTRLGRPTQHVRLCLRH